MKKASRLVCAILTVAFTAAAPLLAGVTPIDISSLANEPWTFQGPDGAGVINGSTFPTGSQNFGGIQFAIPLGPNNYWGGAAATGFGTGAASLNIPVGVPGVISAFTLLNTMWGQAGPQSYLYITFRGSSGATLTRPLIGGVNVRDFNNDGFQNSVNNTSTVQVWTNGDGQRIDRQEYILPAEFASQVLTSVTITDTGNLGFSRAVFAGLTVSTCHAYATETIEISSGQIIFDPASQRYVQGVTLTNTGTTAVAGPLFFILEDLPAGVTLLNKSGATGCFAPVGSRYVEAIAPGSSLAPNTTVVLHLGFSDPSGAAISYMPLAVGSLGGLP